MSIQTKTVLKAFFEDGDSPSGSNFSDLIDSLASENTEYTNITAALTLDDTYHILFCNGTFTVTLPAASSLPGKEYCIKNTGTGVITLGGTIDDAVDPVLAQYAFWWIKSDGTNWQRIGERQTGQVVWDLNDQSGASYTLVLSDAGKIIRCANTCTVTIPANADVAFPIGARIILRQNGTGAVTAHAATGVTFNGVQSAYSVNTEYANIFLIKSDTDTWEITLSPAGWFAVAAQLSGIWRFTTGLETAALKLKNTTGSYLTAFDIGTNGEIRFGNDTSITALDLTKGIKQLQDGSTNAKLAEYDPSTGLFDASGPVMNSFSVIDPTIQAKLTGASYSASNIATISWTSGDLDTIEEGQVYVDESTGIRYEILNSLDVLRLLGNGHFWSGLVSGTTSSELSYLGASGNRLKIGTDETVSFTAVASVRKQSGTGAGVVGSAATGWWSVMVNRIGGVTSAITSQVQIETITDNETIDLQITTNDTNGEIIVSLTCTANDVCDGKVITSTINRL